LPVRQWKAVSWQASDSGRLLPKLKSLKKDDLLTNDK